LRTEPAIPPALAADSLPEHHLINGIERLKVYAQRVEASYDDLRAAYDSMAAEKTRCAIWTQQLR